MSIDSSSRDHSPPPTGLDRRGSVMRLHDDVRQRHELGRDVRLGREHVERRGAQRPSRNAAISAASSTTEPRATLISVPAGPSAAITAADTRCCVSGPPLQAIMRKSLSRASATGSATNS